MARKPRVVVVGSANIDLTTFTDKFPRPGETIFGDHFDLGFGGKGANQAVAAAYCGAEAHMVARVGDDLFGPPTVKNFKALGIGARHVKMVKGVSSGVAPIFVDPSGQNRIFVVKGANDRVTPKAVDEAASLLKRADVIVLQFEIPLETVYHTVRLGKKYGVRTIVNPAPAAPADLKRLAPADYVIPNESEAETITGKPVKTVEEAKACARYLLDQGLSRVILTLGERGALLATREAMELIPAFPVTAKDSTGAGDAFIGSFAVFLAEGHPEREAIRRANLYAGISTTAIGTQKSFIKRAQFNREWRARS
ncbi:MAG TPA: ribokinase [Vicinamibacteria bacterium]|nr:ribokinase [Vicinamibacteria bacterium]